MSDAAARQGGLAALYADLAAIVDQQNPAVPKTILAQASQLLSMRLDSATGINAGGIAAALAQSGLPIGSGAVPAPAGADDLGAALSALRQVLKGWIDAAPSLGSVAGQPPQPAAAQAAVRATAPLPPYRGASTVPQAPAAASIPANAAPRDIALHLLHETDAAIARHMLLQIASHAAEPRSGGRHSDPAQRLMFDIPLATPQGTAVAQICIEPDDRHNEADGAAPVWRASFSVDLEPIGPVHVRLALSGERISVMLNAERANSAARLSDGLPLLETGLRDADLEPAELRCQTGAPRPAPAPPGMFVDHAT